ncbi:uncharacterized protein LOC108916813 [Anoplophora glabripennis]|uniref:uncharacterized protein LOC108916813 n=1 Tax=Anoplophora glabripennis TaxID=217634 RepID=UPI000873A721|nr:uncharacterized protein LOC108916813 [Anoplophora glabripennis]
MESALVAPSDPMIRVPIRVSNPITIMLKDNDDRHNIPGINQSEWRSLKAVVNYPTMKCPINFEEKLSFTSFGQPLLNYRSITWNAETGSPMQLESGFLHIDKDGTSIALIAAQNFGVAVVEEGLVVGNTIITNSSCIGHMKFVKQKIVTIQRCYKLNENGQLDYCVMLETPQTPLTQHIAACYEKCT